MKDKVIISDEPSNKAEKDHADASMSTLHPTASLPILVAIDMFAVALVVPLMNQYFQAAGVESASQREILSSLYSSSQIIGAIFIGGLQDTGIVSPNHILYMSFLGSALSYSLIVFGGFRSLVFSRILVGLIKQTMTVSTSMMARYTTKRNRAKSISRLSASVTFGFIVGPSVGAVLYKHVDQKAPALMASSLFIINFFLATIVLPPTEKKVDTITNSNTKNQHDENTPTKISQQKGLKKFSSFLSNLKSCFSSKALGSVVSSLLLSNCILRATSYASMVSYYESVFGIESHYRGYISSYQKVVSFIVQTFLVQSLLVRMGGEFIAPCICAGIMVIANLMELVGSFPFFLAVICPLSSGAMAVLLLSLKSLLTQVSPKESLSSVLAAVDVLQNAVSVTVPFYRTLLYSVLQDRDLDSAIVGSGSDPDPRLWVISASIHWFITAIIMCLLLLRFHKNEKKKDK